MKYIIKLSVLPLFLFADDTGPLYSEAIGNTFNQEQKTASAAITKDISNSVTANAASGNSNNGTSDIMIVDPKVVAKDWADAFHSLNSRKLNDIIFVLRDNSQIANVSDVEVLSGGYLMLFSLRTLQGPKYRIVKTSDITSISSR